jgi:hypothetical protein
MQRQRNCGAPVGGATLAMATGLFSAARPPLVGCLTPRGNYWPASPADRAADSARVPRAAAAALGSSLPRSLTGRAEHGGGGGRPAVFEPAALFPPLGGPRQGAGAAAIASIWEPLTPRAGAQTAAGGGDRTSRKRYASCAVDAMRYLQNAVEDTEPGRA